MRRRAAFLTVMPSPYQRELFKALHSDGRMQIRVLYCAGVTRDHNWALPVLNSYETLLRGVTFRWLGSSAHFNPDIIRILRDDPSELFVLSDYSAPTTQIAMQYLTWRRKRWVFWGERPGLRPRGPLAGLVRHRLQRPIGSGATAIAAIGLRAVEAYRTLFPGIPVFNIPYFCDLGRFSAAAAQGDRQTNPAVRALFSGQLIERKGVDILINAFVQISGQLPNLHLQLLGTGPDCEKLMQLIPGNLAHRIHFLGFQQPSTLPHIFAAADIFVLPSRHDGWGVVINEALGAGLPIIVSDRVGAGDLVEDGYNGLITSAGDIQGLANALLKLGQSAGFRTLFGRGSAERATRWGLDEGVRRWIELYDKTVVESAR